MRQKNLCKSYHKKAAVTSLNMHVRPGEIYGFIGRNGSGKSTTLKMLCGLAHPTEGASGYLEKHSYRSLCTAELVS